MIKQLLVADVYRVSLREMVEQLHNFQLKIIPKVQRFYLLVCLFVIFVIFENFVKHDKQNFADVNPSPDSFRRANSLYFVIMVYAFEKRELKFPAQLTFSSSLPPTLLNYPEKKRAAHQRFPRVEQNT